MKVCRACGEEKPLEAYYRYKRNADGLMHVCKKCHKAKTTAWQASNPEKHRAAVARYRAENREAERAKVKRYRQLKRDEIRKLKESQPCADCGLKWPYFVMHFDHMPELGPKFANINRLMVEGKWDALADELAKCELVCGNCHAIRSQTRSVGKPIVA